MTPYSSTRLPTGLHYFRYSLLILALLFAFASLIPLWEAQLRGLSDSFFTMFSIIFIFSAITLLQSMFKWYRATALLAIAWLASMGIGHSALVDIELLSPILGMILMAFFLDEIYFHWPKIVKRLIDKDDFANLEQEQSEQDSDTNSENVALRLERLSTVIDETPPYLPSQQDSQSQQQNKQ